MSSDLEAAHSDDSGERRLELLHQVKIFLSSFSSLCEEREEKVGGGEEVDRAVSRKQRELCKLLFDTRFSLCIALKTSNSVLRSCMAGRLEFCNDSGPFLFQRHFIL